MDKKILNILVVGTLVALLSSCGSDSSNPPKADRETEQPLSELEKASCEFKADQGGAAPLFLPMPKMLKPNFQKMFDESLVTSVMDASATETVRFAKLTNLEFYSVGAMSQKSCKMLGFVPAAGQLERTVFADLQKDMPKESTILGVYFSPQSKQFSESNNSAFILIREDTTRWTVVHEYMHHLFSKEVQPIKRDTTIKNELEYELKEFEKVYDAYKISQSNSDLLLMTKSIEKIVRLRTELLRRYTLEEVTIESYLLSQYNAGKFKHVPSSEVRGAKAYIKSSAKAARDNNSSMAKLIDISIQSLASIILESPDLAAEAKLVEAKIQSLKIDLSALMTELDKVELKAVYGYKANGLAEASDVKGDVQTNHASCAHSKNAEGQASAAIEKVLSDLQHYVK